MKIAYFFQGLKLLKCCRPCYIYVGPNAFDTWEGDQVAAQGGDCEVKQCNVTIEFCEIPRHLWFGKARMRMRRMMKRQGMSS